MVTAAQVRRLPELVRLRSRRLAPATTARDQLALPWAADPLLIREALAAGVQTLAPDGLLVPEFSILRGSSRIDLVLLSTSIEGWEVKGDLDDETRLPRQIRAYGKVLDRVTLVVGPRSAARCERVVPRWWGVALASNTTIETIREAERNPSADTTEIADLLWREELRTALLALTGRPGRGSRRSMAERLAVELDAPELSALVSSSIRARTGWRSAA